MNPSTVTIERFVTGPFRSIEVKVMSVTVKVGGPHQGLKLVGEPEVLEKIETAVHCGTLIVAPQPNSSFSTREILHLELATPHLESARVTSGAKLELFGLNSERLELRASSGGRLTAHGVVGELFALAESGASIRLSGLVASTVSKQSRSGGKVS